MNNFSLIYIQDPMCGWCYALDSAIRFVEANLPSQGSVRVLNLGLFTDDNAKEMNQAFQDHLARGTKQVESVSDSKFSDKFFKNIVANNNYLYESTIPGLALFTIQRISRAPMLSLTSELQKKFFVGGQSAGALETYVEMAVERKIAPIRFAKSFFDPAIREKFEAERREAKELLGKVGRNAIPALVVEEGSRLAVVNHEEHRKPEQLLKAVITAVEGRNV